MFTPLMRRSGMNLFAVLCVVGLVLAWPSVGFAFGPGPDKALIKAEREKHEQIRKDVGDHAYITYALARLKLLASRLPVWHHAYEERALRTDTGEHLQETRPYFAHVSLVIIREIGDERALPILESFMSMKQIAHQTQPSSSRWMVLTWHEYDRASEAWLWIKFCNGPYEAAILESLDYGGVSNHSLTRPVLQLLEQGMADVTSSASLISIDESNKINLIEELATTRTGNRLNRWNMLKTLAELRAFHVSDQKMQDMLTSDKLAVRVAAAMVLYRQDAARKARPWTDPEWIKAETEYVKEDPENNAEATAARQAVAKVWRDLIKARRELDATVGQAGWHQKADELDHLLGRFFFMTAFTSTDPYFIDEMVESIGWNGPVAWLGRGFGRDGIPIKPEHTKRLVQWLDDRVADEATLRQIAWMLIELDQQTAADDIVRFFHRSQVLDGLELHPRYVATTHRDSATDANLSPDWLTWLKKHSGGKP